MNTLLIVLLAIAATLSTFLLSQQRGFNAIRASSALTILFYGIMLLLGVDAEFWASVFFGASFIGMSAPHKFSYVALILSSLCFSVFFIALLPFLEGIGGALGCSAFLSVVISHWVWHRVKKHNPFAAKDESTP